MADNIFALLQKAQETASTADAKQFGVELAIVTNNDPSSDNNAPPEVKNGGAVKVKYLRLPGGPESDWVRVAQPAAGAGRGFYWVPEVNDEVLIAFMRGEAHCPYVIGCLWNGVDKPMKNAFNKDNTTRMIQTKSGHQIILEDKKNAEKIIIADKSGKRTMTFDVKNKKFLIEAKEGDVEIHAEKKIILDCEDLEIKTSKNGKLDIGANFDLKISGTGNMLADSVLNIKASRVKIN
jgi:uncharacterized protein involved in type VI secretion and phage assembly